MIQVRPALGAAFGRLRIGRLVRRNGEGVLARIGLRVEERGFAACVARNGSVGGVERVTGAGEGCGAALAEWVATRKLTGCATALSFPRRWFAVRYLDLPSQDPDEVARMASLRASDLFAQDAAELEIGAATVERFENGWARVAFFACPRERLRGVLRVVEASGLRVVAATLDASALVAGFRAAVDADLGAPACLALIEEDVLTLAVAHGEELRYSRQVEWRERRPEEGVAHAFEQQAAAMAIERVLEQSFQAFRRRFPELTPGRLVILASPDAAKVLPAELLSVDVVPQARLTPAPATGADGGPVNWSDLIPLGLAVGHPRPSLIPEFHLRLVRLRTLGQGARRFGVAAAVLAAVGLGTAMSDVLTAERQLRQVTAEMERLEVPAKRLLGMAGRADPAGGSSHACLRGLQALDRSLPAAAHLRSYDFVAPRDVHAAGTAKSLEDVVALARAVERDYRVRRVALAETRQTEAGVDFALQFELSGGDAP